MLNPHQGSIWAARAAGVISGSDHYLDGVGEMGWTLAGMVTVASGDGPDMSRSAAGRAGAEAIWVPTALLPRFGVIWSAADETNIAASYRIGTTPVEIKLALDRDGHPESVLFARWGDPNRTGEWDRHPFGGTVSAHSSFGGLTIPSAGRLGWHYGTDQWSGEFFRYEITDLRALSSGG